MNEVGRLYGNNIVFPGLGIDISPNNEAFSLFGLSIKWYGVLIAFGMLLAMIYCFKRTKTFGIDGDRLTDTVFAGLIGAVIGARLYYVALHAESFHDIRDVFAIRDGGLAIYGGILGALLFGCITAKIRKLRILPTLDLASMGFLIGQMGQLLQSGSIRLQHHSSLGNVGRKDTAVSFESSGIPCGAGNGYKPISARSSLLSL